MGMRFLFRFVICVLDCRLIGAVFTEFWTCIFGLLGTFDYV